MRKKANKLCSVLFISTEHCTGNYSQHVQSRGRWGGEVEREEGKQVEGIQIGGNKTVFIYRWHNP